MRACASLGELRKQLIAALEKAVAKYSKTWQARRLYK